MLDPEWTSSMFDQRENLVSVGVVEAVQNDPDAYVRDSDRILSLRRSGLASGDVRGHLDRLTDLAAELTGAPIALVTLVDGERQTFAGRTGVVGDDVDDTALSHSVCQVVVGTRSPVRIDDLAADDRYRSHPAHTDLDVGAYCGVPIIAPDGHVLGSFCVIDSEAHAWTTDTTRTLTSLSRLVSDLITLNRDYAAVVTDLQDRLVPTSLPAAPHGRLDGLYRAVPSPEAIGGDFYDAVVHDSGAIDLVVGDVVGHGVRSTQAAAQLQAGARALMHDHRLGPARMLEIVDRTVASLPGCDGAAMIAARIDADGSRVRWARAGAMPPLLLDDHAHIDETNSGPPLGTVIGERVECEIRLRPGHGIMFFTDGLVERRTRSLDDRFVELQNRSRNASTLDELASQMVGDDGDDDIAIIRYLHQP